MYSMHVKEAGVIVDSTFNVLENIYNIIKLLNYQLHSLHLINFLINHNIKHHYYIV